MFWITWVYGDLLLVCFCVIGWFVMICLLFGLVWLVVGVNLFGLFVIYSLFVVWFSLVVL